MKKYIIEFTGTFFLVLVIGMTGYQQILLGSAPLLAPLAIGGILMALVYMGGHISGAHYNPAVTLGMLIGKKISGGEAMKYMGVQLLGAVAAAVVFYLLFKSTMNPPVPNTGFSNFIKPLFIEMLFTFVCVLVILNVYAANNSTANSYYGLAIGFIVAASIIAAGPFSGGVVNPASVLGPMIMDSIMGGSSLSNAWFYLVGQFAGGALAAWVFGMTNPNQT